MRFILLAFVMALLVSCQKNESYGCVQIPTPTISVNTMVDAGGTINLSVEDMPGVKYYEWTGPGGFTSSEQSPVIRAAQSNCAGRYQVRITFIGGCVKTVTSDSVIVMVPAAPCTPNGNTVKIEGVSSFSVYSVTGGVSGGSYFITANGNYGDVELEFAGKTKPVTGVYSIRPGGGQWLAGDVRVIANSQSSIWPSYSGKVYVSVTNNKVTATFCNVPVTGQTYGINSTLSGKLTEQ